MFEQFFSTGSVYERICAEVSELENGPNVRKEMKEIRKKKS